MGAFGLGFFLEVRCVFFIVAAGFFGNAGYLLDSNAMGRSSMIFNETLKLVLCKEMEMYRKLSIDVLFGSAVSV